MTEKEFREKALKLGYYKPMELEKFIEEVKEEFKDIGEEFILWEGFLHEPIISD